MLVEAIVREFHKLLTKLYKDKLVEVVLFGSWVRGEETQDFDIDVLVVIKGEIIPGREIDKMIEIITSISLKYDVLLSVIPVSEKVFEEDRLPLFKNVKSEGIIIE